MIFNLDTTDFHMDPFHSKYMYLLVLLLLFTVSPEAESQPRQMMEPLEYVFLETVHLISDDPASGRLDVNYRILNNFFIFTRTTDPTAPKEFRAQAEIIIEIFDSRGRSAAREIVQPVLYNDVARQELPDVDYLEGLFSFTLAPDEYRLYVEVRDLQSARRYINKDMRAHVKAHPEGKLAVSDVLFLEPLGLERPTTVFTPLNLGGNIFFGRNFDGYIEFISSAPPDAFPTVITSLYRITGERRGTVALYSDTLGAENFYSGKKLMIDSFRENYVYLLTPSNRPDRRSAFLNFRGNQLEEGSYRIEISINDGKESTTKTTDFRVRWITKPLSLRNLDFSIEMMQYILTQEEFRKLRQARQPERRELFQQFWKEKDPDPETAYNPVLAEYFRRVDFAAREFQTLKERNGAKTDRGRIYILYGAPTEIDRSLVPGQPPRETWVYNHLRRKFVFVDQGRDGDYRLIAREDI